jgi:hypothetical protein
LPIEDSPLYRLVGVVGLPRLELLLEVCRVLFSATSVGNDVELIGKACDNSVVDNASSVGM